MKTPSLPFEDLCRAAIEEGNLEAIRSASIVTDSETLWALFSTLHDKVIKTDYYGERKRGIIIVVHRVERTTFLKVINLEAIDDANLMAATAHLKKHRLRWCWRESPDDSTPKKDMNAFRRVISYNFGGVKIVVEDGNQVLSSAHDCDELEDVVAFEPWV